MIIQIGNVLNSDEVLSVREALSHIAFEDGRATAGWNAKLVKNNQQARPGSGVESLRTTVTQKIKENDIFSLAVRPKTITPLLFSRYEKGNAYGTHVDNALMQGMRVDVSFTLFLSDPDTYEGGELIIETTAGEQAFKLPAGAMITYPATTLHRVGDVAHGERLVAVGWVRSYIRDPQHRELLFDLETARRSLFEREGKSHEFDLLSKCAANLVRQWADD